jgi:O-antigen/teichoic acid export membrane protein
MITTILLAVAAVDPAASPVSAATALSIDRVQWIALIGAFLVMLAGLWFTFDRLKALGQGFGPNSLRALGTVLFLPTVVILAVASHFQSETLAALLGTIAGYILSRSESEQKSSGSKPPPPPAPDATPKA